MKVTEIGVESLKPIAIHAISRTGDVPLTSGKMYDMTAAAAVRTTSGAWLGLLGVKVCAVRVVLTKQKSQVRACVLHSAISGASSY
jgi:hypothetical protein